MQVSETRQLFDQACEFPADRETVVERLGDVELAAPNGETVTLDAVLDVTDQARYRSTDDLYNTVLGNLDDSFVGRKYYDDRAGARGGVSPVRDGEQPSPSF